MSLGTVLFSFCVRGTAWVQVQFALFHAVSPDAVLTKTFLTFCNSRLREEEHLKNLHRDLCEQPCSKNGHF